jgi:hypothetical protein
VWAFAIVTLSLASAYVLDAAGAQWSARAALAPVYPVLLLVVAIRGGFHAASGEPQWMIVAAVVSVLVWWAILAGCRRLFGWS